MLPQCLRIKSVKLQYKNPVSVAQKTANGLWAGRVAGTETVKRIPLPSSWYKQYGEKDLMEAAQTRVYAPIPLDPGTGRGFDSILRTQKRI